MSTCNNACSNPYLRSGGSGYWIALPSSCKEGQGEGEHPQKPTMNA